MSGKFSKAIWKEINRLVEDVALTKWIDKEGQQIYCPKKNYNHALKNNLSPTKEWHKFPLIKCKITDGQYLTCFVFFLFFFICVMLLLFVAKCFIIRFIFML